MFVGLVEPRVRAAQDAEGGFGVVDCGRGEASEGYCMMLLCIGNAGGVGCKPLNRMLLMVVLGR